MGIGTSLVGLLGRAWGRRWARRGHLDHFVSIDAAQDRGHRRRVINLITSLVITERVNYEEDGHEGVISINERSGTEVAPTGVETAMSTSSTGVIVSIKVVAKVTRKAMSRRQSSAVSAVSTRTVRR